MTTYSSSCHHHPHSTLTATVLLVMSFLIWDSGGQNITRFFVPTTARIGDSVFLICEYSLSRGQKIYTHKWYKEEKEFWRHEPRQRPAYQYFNVSGINVDKFKSNRTHILLKNLSIDSGGHYTCEFSIEGNYDTFISDGRMTVLLPTASTSSSKRRNASPPLLPSSSTPVLAIVSLVTGLFGLCSSLSSVHLFS